MGKRNFHEDIKKVFEPVIKTIKGTSEVLTKTLMVASTENNEVIPDVNNKFLERMKDQGSLASYLLYPLSKITNLGHTSQVNLVKDRNTNRVNDILMNKTIPVTLNDNLAIFRDTVKEFKLKRDLLEKITNKNYNADLPKLPDKKCICMTLQSKYILMTKL